MVGPICYNNHNKEWEDSCRVDIVGSINKLLSDGKKDQYDLEKWHIAINISSEDDNRYITWPLLAETLFHIPEKIVLQLSGNIGHWLQKASPHINNNVDTLQKLVSLLLKLEYSSHDLDIKYDLVSQAINHPIGRVTDAVISWWYAQEPQDSQGIIGEAKSLLTHICDTNNELFIHGRLILASHTLSLFRVDPEWSLQYLLPLYDWDKSQIEASAAWQGFLRSPKLDLPLLSVIKESLLQTVEHFEELGDYADQYAGFLTFIALNRGDVFSVHELRGATQMLPPDGLVSAVEILLDSIKGAGSDSIKYWEEKLVPYFNTIWPKSNTIIHSNLSDKLGQLCIEIEDRFNEAFEVIQQWLGPVEHPFYLVDLISEKQLCAQFPIDILGFLYIIIDTNTQFPITNLRECLDAIIKANTDLENDPRYKRLRRLCEMWGE